MGYLGNLGLDKEEYVSDREFELLPAGAYPVEIMESSVEHNKSGTGQLLTLKMKIQDGTHKGRYIWDRINIVHDKPDVERIGRTQLRKLLEILELPLTLTETSKMHYKPIICVLKIVKRKDNGEDTNQVSYYKPIGDNKGEAPIAAPVAEVAKKPWGKK